MVLPSFFSSPPADDADISVGNTNEEGGEDDFEVPEKPGDRKKRRQQRQRSKNSRSKSSSSGRAHNSAYLTRSPIFSESGCNDNVVESDFDSNNSQVKSCLFAEIFPAAFNSFFKT